MQQKETFCPRKEFHTTKTKYLVTGINFLSQDEISCQKQKCPVTGRNFLSQKETSCHRNKFHVTVKNFLSKGEIPKLPLFWTSSVASDSRCFGQNFWLKVLVPTKLNILSHPGFGYNQKEPIKTKQLVGFGTLEINHVIIYLSYISTLKKQRDCSEQVFLIGF